MSTARRQRPAWINDRAAHQGFVQLGDKRYPTGADQFRYDEDSERSVLGCILVAGETGNGRTAIQRVGFMHYDDFFVWAHGVIFRAMERVYSRGDEIDLTSVKAELQATRAGNKTVLEQIGGEAYLLSLMNVPAVNIETYARNVVRMALRRSLKLSTRVAGDLADSENIELDDLLQRVFRMVQDISTRYYAISDQDTHNLYDALDAHQHQVEAELDDDDYRPAMPTGLAKFDNVISGWRRGKMYIFAAPPGWGKTALFLCFALYALQQGHRVLFLSLEMPVEDMISRLICIQAGIDSTRFLNRKLNKPERERMAQAYEELKGYQASRDFIISRLKRPTMEQIRSKVEEYYLNPGIDLVMLDYATAEKIQTPHDDGFAAASYIYGELEGMKEDYPESAFIVATQMNSKWDSRKGKRPGETDLYYGTVGYQVADFVGFIFHESKVNRDKPDDGLAEILTRKNRSGRSNNVATILRWESEFTRFSDAGDKPPLLPKQEDDHWSLDL